MTSDEDAAVAQLPEARKAGEPVIVRPADPVDSGPVDSLDRFARWCVREPQVARLFALVALAFLLGFFAVLWQWRQAEAAAALARTREAAATAALADARENFQRAQRLVRDLSDAAEQIAGQPRLEKARRALLERVLAYHEAFLQDNSRDPGVLFESALAYERVGWIQGELGQAAPAADALRKAGTLLDRLQERFPADLRYRSARAWSYYWTGLFQATRLQKPAAAAASLEHGITILEGLVAEFPRAGDYRSSLAVILTRWATIRAEQGDTADAEQAFLRVIALERAALKNASQPSEARRDLALGLEGYGNLLWKTNRLKNAEAALREAVGLLERIANNQQERDGIHDDLARVQGRFAGLLEATGRSAEAEEVLRKAYLGLRRLNNAVPDMVRYRRALTSTAVSLADLLDASGRPDEALEAYREAIGLSRRLVADFPEADADANGLAWLLATVVPPALRDPDQAVELATRAVTLAPESARCWTTLGVARYRAGDARAARTDLEKSLALGSGGPRALEWLFLAMTCRTLGEKDQAHAWYTKALRAIDENPPVSIELRRFRDEARALLREPVPHSELIP